MKDNKDKDMISNALLDATTILTNGNRAKFTTIIKSKVGNIKVNDIHNCINRGGNLAYSVAIAIYEHTQVSLDRLQPHEKYANDNYYKAHPFVNIITVEHSDVEYPPYYSEYSSLGNQDTDPRRPIIMSLTNELIYGHHRLKKAQHQGHNTITAIRLDPRALLECKRDILMHPEGWLAYEFNTIAQYLKVYAHYNHMSHIDHTHNLSRLVIQPSNHTSVYNLSHLTFFKSIAKKAPEKTKQKLPSNLHHKSISKK